MKLRQRTARTVQCLYCETQLKPFRGLFDEDFCCREHRDKYFSSFRKSLNRLPELLEIPPVAPTAQSVSPAMFATEEPVFSTDSAAIPAGTVELPYTEALAATDDMVEVDLVEEYLLEKQATPPVDVPAETLEPAWPLAAITAEESSSAVVSYVPYLETLADPPVADFLHLAVAAIAGAQSARGSSFDALPASYAIEVPGGEMAWPALLEMEQRPAELLEVPQMAAATAFVPMPTPLELSAERPAITQSAAMLPEATLPDAAESDAHAQYLGVCGHKSPWNYADPLTPAPVALSLASFCPAADGAAWLPTAEFAELSLACLPPTSSPISVPEMELVHVFYPPVLTPRQTMLPDEEGDEMIAGDSSAPAEIAPARAMNSAPVDRPALLPTCAAEMMPPALEFSSAHSSAPVQMSAPGLASTFEGQPNLAPELMADIPQTPAANQAAKPHAHAPLRHLFGSSVRIKNWRLRITFAKPAEL